MSITNGVDANATNFNNAFASKSADNTLNGKQTLNRAGSGATITDLQQTVNNQSSSITTAQSNIATLQTDMTTAQTNISTLQGQVSTLNALDTFVYVGSWDASTNSPTLADGDGGAAVGPGAVYRVTVAGTQNLGSGSVTYAVNDKVVYNTLGVWEKWDVSDEVLSVNGQTGAVSIALDNITDVAAPTPSQRDLLTKGATDWVNTNPNDIASEAGITGANQSVPAHDAFWKLIRVTNAGLTSLEGIVFSYNQQKIILANATGVAITIKNNAAATPTNGILTGVGTDITMQADQCLLFVYDSVATRWRIVGGSAGSSTLANNTFYYARNAANTLDLPLFKLNASDQFEIYSNDGTTLRANWQLSRLYDGAGFTSIRFDTARSLRDAAEVNSVLWGSRTLLNSVSGVIVDWENMVIYDENATSAIEFKSTVRNLYDEVGIQAVEFLSTSRGLYNEAGVKVLNFITQQLFDTIPSLSLDWATRATYDGAGNISFDWENRVLYDAVAAQSLDFGNADRSISFKVFKWFNSATDPVFAAQSGDTYYNTTTGPKYYNGSAWVTFGGSGASTTLNNLGTTSINADLLPSATNTRKLGSASLLWSELHVVSRINIDGTLDITNSFTSPSGTTVIGLNTTSNTPLGFATRTTTGATKNIFIETGNSTGGSTTGNFEFKTGDVTGGAGNSGDIHLKSGAVTGTGNRGDLNVECRRTLFEATNTPGGTTGNQTINKQSGTVNFAAAATSLTVTNDRVTANSLVFCQLRTNDATAVLGAVVPAAGSFTIYMTTAPTAETSVGFVCFNA